MPLDYKLDDLGWFEFEQLVQTLLKARLGLGLEAWGGWGDWGRDAYFAGTLRYPGNEKTKGDFVFQSKFVESANAAGAQPEDAILNSVRKECTRIRERLATKRWSRPPTCYSLLTNAPLCPALRQTVTNLIAKVLLKADVRIHDGADICKWLRISPEIVRSFPQLLSLRDLQQLLRDTANSDIIVRSETAIALAKAHARVFVPTEAYATARTKLGQYHFVVLEGPPEMGKTTIGRIIALSQIVCGCEAIECRSPSDLLKMYRKDTPQVFVADDFFGRTEYDPVRVSEWQSDLGHILPILDHKHWLILTCRAHLLEMAKANLDIPDHNNKFPELGEVIVNAGRLTRNERARILYRHAKAVGLTQRAKQLIRNHAVLIVNHPHFTPERIRRLAEEVVPRLAIGRAASEAKVESVLSEALTNPTKQMRISFRNLPESHRWMLFALLEVDRTGNFLRGSAELEDRYNALCPADLHQPFKRVIHELTEAFVKKTPGMFAEEIDWIHPSCRDLAIDELSENARERSHFLSNCSITGLSLASSFAGGAEGARQLPLLQTESDWKQFATRAAELATKDPGVLFRLWQNYLALKKELGGQRSIAKALPHLLAVVKQLLGFGRHQIENGPYSPSRDLEMFFEMCKSLKLPAEISLGKLWLDCREDVIEWLEHPDDPWEDAAVPERVSNFIKVLNKFAPAFLKQPEIEKQLNQILNSILERAEADMSFSYSSTHDEDELTRRAAGFDQLNKSFGELALLPIWTPQQGESLKDYAGRFHSEAEALREEVPWGPDTTIRTIFRGHPMTSISSIFFETSERLSGPARQVRLHPRNPR